MVKLTEKSLSKLQEFRNLAAQIRQQYDEMTEVFGGFQAASKLHCPKGCGKCCANPSIEATPLEMLPMVIDLLDSNKLTTQLLDSLDQFELCFVFSKSPHDYTRGECLEYKNRPSICRMFGVAGHKLKDDTVSVSVCKTLKDKHPNEYLEFKANLKDAPLMSKWSTKIRVLDPELGFKYYQINQAFKIMAHKILLLSDYNQFNS